MWTIDYDNVTLFNKKTHVSIDFDYSDTGDFVVVQTHTPMRFFRTSREAIDFIHTLADLFDAVSVPPPPVE